MSTGPVIPAHARVCYAEAAGGQSLPVVDITNPAFSVEVEPDDMPHFVESAIGDLRRFSRVPMRLRRLVTRRSALLGGGPALFMSGMTTYLNKLGPANLDPHHFGKFDRRTAGMLASVAVRLRLRAVAALIEKRLRDSLDGVDGQTVHLVNIGGGSGMDSINALLLLRESESGSLSGRRFVIQVLDIDEAGPRFGASALAALRAPDGPLAGVDVSLVHTPYDWSRPTVLGDALHEVGATPLVGSTEGGLFEYASDEVIASNLRALAACTPPGFRLVGTSWRDVEAAHVLRSTGIYQIILRSTDCVERLAADTGWNVDEEVDGNPVYHVFSLTRAAVSP